MVQLLMKKPMTMKAKVMMKPGWLWFSAMTMTVMVMVMTTIMMKIMIKLTNLAGCSSQLLWSWSLVMVMKNIMMKINLTNLAGCSSLPTPGSWLVHTEQFLERLNTTCLAISTIFYASILLRVKLCTRIGPAATADKVWQFPQTYFDKYSFCWVLDLLILPVLESVDEGVDCGRHPGEHAGDIFVIIFGINSSVELIWSKVSVK